MLASSEIRQLRAHAIAQTFFPPTTLKAAIDRMGFVQADPIRAPARAQDLILRHRVKDYRAGDLERRYPSLDLEEDLLYAYGFMPRDVWRLIHPRTFRRLTKFERQVLDFLQGTGQKHPRDLHVEFGSERVINDWGGYSKATKRALEHLHHRGLLRVCRRENGVRVYEAAPVCDDAPSPSHRARALTMLLAKIFAPVREASLRVMLRHVLRHVKWNRRPQRVFAELFRSGELEAQSVDGVTYVWPALKKRFDDEAPEIVRFLAPFDPLVWSRRRFEHLWGWAYRFEAYTPAAKRVRGYYALPLLWRDDVIGWANVSQADGQVKADLGFVDARPRDRKFENALETEIDRMKTFLGSKTAGKLESRTAAAPRV